MAMFKDSRQVRSSQPTSGGKTSKSNMTMFASWACGARKK
jgi:hypothetical protein